MAELVKQKFRILHGSHVQNDDEGVSCNYVKGDVIETHDLMIARDTNKFQLVDPATKLSVGTPCGPPPGELNSSNAVIKPKKRKVEPPVEPTNPPTPSGDSGKDEGDGDDTFSSMTIAELKEFAAGEEIDVSKCKHKDDFVKACRDATAKV